MRRADCGGPARTPAGPRAGSPTPPRIRRTRPPPPAASLPLGPLRWGDAFPKLPDRLPTSPFDPHYFHQDTWAARRIAERRPARHVDVGSRVDLVGFLTAVTQVTFVDIRPLEVDIEGLESVAGSVLA